MREITENLGAGNATENELDNNDSGRGAGGGSGAELDYSRIRQNKVITGLDKWCVCNRMWSKVEMEV